MRKLTAALALVALISSVTIADARGGRTTAEDCEAGSADPDCPDTQGPPKKSDTSSTQGQPSGAAPGHK
jgi:hypothetical protein